MERHVTTQLGVQGATKWYGDDLRLHDYTYQHWEYIIRTTITVQLMFILCYSWHVLACLLWAVRGSSARIHAFTSCASDSKAALSRSLTRSLLVHTCMYTHILYVGGGMESNTHNTHKGCTDNRIGYQLSVISAKNIGIGNNCISVTDILHFLWKVL